MLFIFSLVRSRSSQSDGIGFLGIDNRVCLALSRARRGLYMLGNAAHLAGSSKLWRRIISILKSPADGSPQIGFGIPVTCRHGVTTVMKSKHHSSVWHQLAIKIVKSSDSA